MIPQAFIDDIQTRTDIVEIISGYIPLKRAGRNFKTTCPFHAEKTPSFMVSPQKQIFHCFGCGEGGGVMQFLMLYEKLTFVEAVEMLAKRLGMEIPYQNTEQGKFRNVLYEALNEASLFFHKNLLQEQEAKTALQYLAKRGIDTEIIKRFRIGYATGRNSLLEYMRKKGFKLDALEKASLVIAQNDSYRDLFRERIIFPIFDVRSRVIGFGARLWKDAENAPKYINSLESPVHSKRYNLFGLNFSKEDILKNNAIIIVEGYLDMIVPFSSGIRNIVASLGTSFTLEQIQLIRRYTNNVVLVFDSDKAGELATLRALDLLLENELKVKIAKLPQGLDPDSLVREQGSEAFLKIINDNVAFFDYKVNFLKNTHDIESIEGKTKIAQEMFSTIQKLSSEIEKYEYLKKLAYALGIKEEILIAEFKQFFSKNYSGWQKKQNILAVKEPLSVTEKVLVKFMLTNSKAFSIIKKNFTEEDFTSLLARKTVSYFLKNYPENEKQSCSKFLGNIEDKEISSFVSMILMDDDTPLDEKIFKESILRLRQRRLKVLKEKLRQEIKAAETAGDKQKLSVLMGKYGSIK
jgi:DNA primase